MFDWSLRTTVVHVSRKQLHPCVVATLLASKASLTSRLSSSRAVAPGRCHKLQLLSNKNLLSSQPKKHLKIGWLDHWKSLNQRDFRKSTRYSACSGLFWRKNLDQHLPDQRGERGRKYGSCRFEGAAEIHLPLLRCTNCWPRRNVVPSLP